MIAYPTPKVVMRKTDAQLFIAFNCFIVWTDQSISLHGLEPNKTQTVPVQQGFYSVVIPGDGEEKRWIIGKDDMEKEFECLGSL